MADKISLDRRGFLAGLAGSCAAVPAAFAFDGKAAVGNAGGIAYSRTLPVKVKTDVFIAGGGSAGVAAAVSARSLHARQRTASSRSRTST